MNCRHTVCDSLDFDDVARLALALGLFMISAERDMMRNAKVNIVLV